MDAKISLSLRQVLILLILVILITAIATLFIFIFGQQSGLSLVRGTPTPKITATPTMPPLPKAMTATPKPKETQQIIFTDETAARLLQEGAVSDAPVQVQSVHFTSQSVTLAGELNYMGYQGALEMEGLPYVENQRLLFRVSSITLDGQPLPQLLFPAVEEQANSLFKQMLDGYDIQAVELQDGQMIVTASPW